VTKTRLAPTKGILCSKMVTKTFRAKSVESV